MFIEKIKKKNEPELSDKDILSNCDEHIWEKKPQVTARPTPAGTEK